jgi:Ca-activated chloride channel family protein
VLRNGLGGIKRVFLMSDGLANVGVIDRHAIARLASSMRRNGVRISTMGLGLDYDEDLMQVVAESGGGNYYFIEHPNQIARIFSEEMGRLDRLVSRDATLEFNWGHLVKRAEVVGYPSSRHGRKTRVNLTDFYQGENRTVLVKLDLAPCNRGRVNIGKLTLGYEDLVDGRKKRISRPVNVVCTREVGEVRKNENKKAAVESRLIVADQEHEEAVRLYESGKAPAAKQAMAALSQKLNKDMDRYQDAQIQKKLDALAMEKTEIAQAESDETYRKSYLKKRKSAFYSSQKGNRAGYMLQEGTQGYQVKDLQQALKKEGFYKGPEDGVFDDEVRQAVEEYQKAKGIPVDGIAGPKTLKGLGLY